MSAWLSYEHADEKTLQQSPDIAKDVEGGAGGETQDVYGADGAGVDPVYQAKARVLNDAFQEIGMGQYQVRRAAAAGGVWCAG